MPSGAGQRPQHYDMLGDGKIVARQWPAVSKGSRNNKRNARTTWPAAVREAGEGAERRKDRPERGLERSRCRRAEPLKVRAQGRNASSDKACFVVRDMDAEGAGREHQKGRPELRGKVQLRTRAQAAS